MNAQRQHLYTGALTAMHACWLVAWVLMLEGAASAAVPVEAGVAALLVLAVAARLLLERTRLHNVGVSIVYWVLWPFAASLAAKLLLFYNMSWLQPDWFLALPRAPLSLFFEPQVSEVILVIGSGAAWYLGQRPVFRQPGYAGLLADFQFGVTMLLIAFLIGYGFGVEVSGALLLTIVFFGVAISAIASARSSQDDGRSAGLTHGHLSAAIVSAVAAVCLTAVLVIAIARPETINAVLDGVRYVGGLIDAGIRYLASLVPTPDYYDGEPPVAPSTGDDSFLREFYRSLPVPAIIRRIIYVVWVTIVAGVLLFALWRMCEQVLQWLRRRRSPAEGAIVESTGRNFWQDLATLLRLALRSLRHGAAFVRGRIGRRYGRSSPRNARDIYLDVIAWTGKKVVPRAPWQSPYEYLEALRPRVPAALGDLQLVTAGYVDERYARQAVSGSRLAEMAEAAGRIRHTRPTRGKGPRRGESE